MKGRLRFYETNIHTPLGNSLPSVYSRCLGNKDSSLKAFPSKCCNHSEQINTAAFTPGLIGSRKTEEPQKPPVPPGSLASTSCPPSAALLLMGRLTVHWLLARPHTSPWQECILRLSFSSCRNHPGKCICSDEVPPNQLLRACSARKGRPWVAACSLWYRGCSHMAGAAVPCSFHSPQHKRQ